MKILILDDDETRHEQFRTNFAKHQLVHTYTVDEAIRALKIHRFDCIMLDHDLGGKSFVKSGGPEPTGYDVAVWIRSNLDYKPEIYIHSMNPAGAKLMQSVIPWAELAPGIWTVEQ